MNPQPKFFRSLALIAALGVGLTACGEDAPIVFPDPLPTISASPQQMNLVIGQTQAIIPTITGLTNTAVTYASTNTAVASVTAAGVVTAVSVGAATIRVTSQAQPTLETGVGVNVTAVPITPVDSARVIIQSVTKGGTILPVDPDSVTGVIDITMSVTRGAARTLRVTATTRAGTREICRQTFGAAPSVIADVGAQEVAAQTENVVCSVDTRADSVAAGTLRGIPRYPNGPLTVRAELLNTAGATLDAATRGTFTLANSDFIRAAVVSRIVGTTNAQRNAIGDTGLLWYGNGDLELQLTPVIFSAVADTSRSYPGRVFVSLTGWVEGARVTTSRDTTVLTTGGFVVRFPRSASTANGGVANFNTGSEGSFIQVNTVTLAGQPGPASDTSAVRNRFVFTDLQSGTALLNSILRWDNENPQVGRLTLGRHPAIAAIWARNGWVNSAYNFFSGKDGEHDAPYIRNNGATGPRAGVAPPAAPSPAPAPSNSPSIPTAAFAELPTLPDSALRGVGYDSTVIFALAGSRPDTARASVVINTSSMRYTRALGTVRTTLAQTITNSEITVVARVWDRLGNFSDVILTRATAECSTGCTVAQQAGVVQTGNPLRIGADFNIPVITTTKEVFPPGTAYNPATTYTVQLRDSLDGIAVVRMNRMTHACPTGTATGRQCAPAPATNADTTTNPTSPLPGSGVSWRTNPVSDAGFESFTRTINATEITVEAYHRFNSYGWDRAGNLTGPQASPFPLMSKTFILDRTNPLVGNVQLPTAPLLLGGTSYDFAARVSDNVEVRMASVGFDFSNGVQLPFENVHMENDPETSFGPDRLVLDSLVLRSVAFVRRLSSVTATGVPRTLAQDTLYRPIAARFRVWDHSTLPGRFSTQATNIVENTVDAGRRNWGKVAATDYQIERTGWSGNNWQVYGRTGTFVNPFTSPGRVLFYARVNVNNIPLEPATTVNYLIGPAAGVGVQDTGETEDGRVWTFVMPAIPSALAQSELPFTVFAVGVTSSGDALMSLDGPNFLGSAAP